jgi:hypothetical protein
MGVVGMGIVLIVLIVDSIALVTAAIDSLALCTLGICLGCFIFYK